MSIDKLKRAKPRFILAYLFAHDRRAKTARVWVVLNVAYDLIRSGIMTLLFHKHGVSGWLYLVITLVFSVPFSYASFRLSIALYEHNAHKALLFGLVTAVSFYAPDTYILIASRRVPSVLYAVFGVYVFMATFIVVRQLIRKSHERPKS